ncbi:MAG TPA: DUF3617 family protein [Casimicrobiaceae bacterium]|nr:DUF3617 family protein [Casimicrobiaceae bacterium]
MRCRVLLVALAAAFGTAPAAATLNMHEGLWETTLTVDGRARSVGTKCYTRADIVEMENMLQGRSSRGSGSCRYSNFAQSGDSVSYTMTCPLGDDEQASSVSAIYRGDSATGTVRAAGATVTTSSRRIGDCAESSFSR